jgi:hypothetical protein
MCRNTIIHRILWRSYRPTPSNWKAIVGQPPTINRCLKIRHRIAFLQCVYLSVLTFEMFQGLSGSNCPFRRFEIATVTYACFARSFSRVSVVSSMVSGKMQRALAMDHLGLAAYDGPVARVQVILFEREWICALALTR